MPRKQNTQSENFNKPFPKALRKIMEENNTTQSELAAYINKTRQVVSCYCDGSASPTWETVAAIAQYYKISADWLLGLSEVRSTDTLVKDVCEYTGLSEKAASFLHAETSNHSKPLDEVNRLFENFGEIHGLICEIATAMKAIRKNKQQGRIVNPLPQDVAAAVVKWENEDGGVMLDRRQAADWHSYHAGNMLRDLIVATACVGISPSFTDELAMYSMTFPECSEAQDYGSSVEEE